MVVNLRTEFTGYGVISIPLWPGVVVCASDRVKSIRHCCPGEEQLHRHPRLRTRDTTGLRTPVMVDPLHEVSTEANKDSMPHCECLHPEESILETIAQPILVSTEGVRRLALQWVSFKSECGAPPALCVTEEDSECWFQLVKRDETTNGSSSLSLSGSLPRTQSADLETLPSHPRHSEHGDELGQESSDRLRHLIIGAEVVPQLAREKSGGHNQSIAHEGNLPAEVIWEPVEFLGEFQNDSK